MSEFRAAVSLQQVDVSRSSRSGISVYLATAVSAMHLAVSNLHSSFLMCVSLLLLCWQWMMFAAVAIDPCSCLQQFLVDVEMFEARSKIA